MGENHKCTHIAELEDNVLVDLEDYNFNERHD